MGWTIIREKCKHNSTDSKLKLPRLLLREIRQSLSLQCTSAHHGMAIGSGQVSYLLQGFIIC